MVKIVLTPDWFVGKDLIIDIFSFLVLLTFTIVAYRYYKFSKNKRISYLGAGFGLIALALLADIVTKAVLYYDIGPSRQIGQAIVTSHLVSSVDIFYYIGFCTERFLSLLGLYVIYRLPRSKKSLGDYAIVGYFLLVSAIVSDEFYYVFHITALIFLVLIVYNYYQIYKENKFFNTKILMIAFSILAMSELIFILSKIPALFVLGEIVGLISYSIFLALIFRIWKYGKKKKQNGNNIRHAGNSSGKRRQY